MPSPTQVRGYAAEQRALDHLMSQGLMPVTRNAHSRVGEVDLIVRDGDELVFVEVRLRSGAGFGGALASVGPAKQAKLRRAAQRWLLKTFGERPWPPCRFDVIAIEGDALQWIRAAF